MSNQQLLDVKRALLKSANQSNQSVTHCLAELVAECFSENKDQRCYVNGIEFGEELNNLCVEKLNKH